ncbi:MAG: DUF1553 domain-containing protein [Gemmataceae bacterium]
MLDYFFIDSGGHLPGAKPALDTDNFLITDSEPTSNKGAQGQSTSLLARQEKMKILRQQIEQQSREVESLQRDLAVRLASGPVELAYAVTEGTPHQVPMQLRGEPEKPGPEVPRGFVEFLGQSKLPASIKGSGRLELAQWVTRPDHPLTARVMVNRVWKHHFGWGLVATPNDFGVRGQVPRHPEVLDYLATRFIESGWSLKSLHRLILRSAAWQQVSPADGTPGYHRRRLDAEEIRDSILVVSGAMDSVPGRTHPFPPAPSWGFTQHEPFSASYDHDKRSVYLMVQRIKRHPFLALFDGADPNASVADRGVTTVPTQALYFLNDPFVHEKSLRFAERLRRASLQEDKQIELAYRLALSRTPTPEERVEAQQFLRAYEGGLRASPGAEPRVLALAAFSRVLFGSNEFLYLD